MPAPETRERCYIRVEGHVQGVGFRYFTKGQADALGLTGYVRNLPNGDVELEAEGPPAGIACLEDFVRSGPPGARVDKLSTQPRPCSTAPESGFDNTY